MKSFGWNGTGFLCVFLYVSPSLTSEKQNMHLILCTIPKLLSSNNPFIMLKSSQWAPGWVSLNCSHISQTLITLRPRPVAFLTTSISLTHLLDYGHLKKADTNGVPTLNLLSSSRGRESRQLPHFSPPLSPLDIKTKTKSVYSPNGSSILELTCVFTLTMSSSASSRACVLIPPLFPPSPQGAKCGSSAQGAVVWEGCCWCKVRPTLPLLSYWFS